jgi:hypothetical protein
MAELPESMEKIQKEASIAMTAGKQLKTKLSAKPKKLIKDYWRISTR